MKIPPHLANGYRTDHALDSFVSTSLDRIEGHISANSLVFFPEYTDHGIEHIEATLQTAFDFATDDAKKLITPVDATVLCVSVGLHDLGMYLTREGFESLIAKNSKWKGVPFFDKESWLELWEDFYSEATRFDDRKLKSLLGEKYRPVRQPPKRGLPWEELDYLLVGEFLRRHHPRLAHEIALYGLPAKNGGAVDVCPHSTDQNKFLADISGLIARSHGLDLRTCMAYLDDRYGNRIDPRGAHAIFIGVLIRISDYFQIQATRAPKERTDVTSFRSSVSDCEWKVHQSVTDIHNSGSDPEAIVIQASPPNVETFLRLKNWLTGLQNELDKSWAILGEVFALQTHIGLQKLGLKIRRIKSNLDDVVTFSKGVQYVPAKIAFEAANTDLLKLLVAPLYGEDAGIGVRELIQNAIDAVREFEDLERHHPELKKIDRYVQDADVVIHIERNEDGDASEIVVTDRGVGMTPDVVQEYFLRAGASFRKSDVWRQEHEDAFGRSRVLRTGRFGVGALAAFLLGDEIEVTTRHAQIEREGITFKARIDDDAISILKVPCPVGTKIRIRIPPTLQARASQLAPGGWESGINFHSEIGHYFLKQPSLMRSFSGQDKEYLPEHWLPQPTDSDSEEWRCFTAKGFEKIFWTYLRKYPNISCNGIVVSNSSKLDDLSDRLTSPRISVFDKDGYLPVNLQRTGLQTTSLPFDKELLRSISDDLLAHAFVEGANTCEADWLDGAYPGFIRSGYYYENQHWANWFITPHSFVLNDRDLLKHLKPNYVIIAIGGDRGYQKWGGMISKAIPRNSIIGSYIPNSLSDSNNRIKGIFQSVVNGSGWALSNSGIDFSPLQAFIPEVTIRKVKGLRPGREVQEAITIAQKGEIKKGWRCVDISEGPMALDLANAITAIKINPLNPVMFLTGEISNIRTGDKMGVTAAQWLKNLGRPDMPFNLASRRKLESQVSKHVQKLIRIYRNGTKKAAEGQTEDET
jgi:molecular chaperone HtpG